MTDGKYKIDISVTTPGQLFVGKPPVNPTRSSGINSILLRTKLNTRKMEYMNIERFREIYTEWQESGQSVRSYAASIGMKEAMFYYWQSRRSKSPCVQVAKKTGGFVQMKPVGHPQIMTHIILNMVAWVRSIKPSTHALISPK